MEDEEICGRCKYSKKEHATAYAIFSGSDPDFVNTTMEYRMKELRKRFPERICIKFVNPKDGNFSAKDRMFYF